MAEIDEREEELSTLSAIYPELTIDTAADPFTATLELVVMPTKPMLVRFVPEFNTYPQAAARSAAHIEHDVELSHLPSLRVQVKLPSDYPANSPPETHITTKFNWLPISKLAELQDQAVTLWEEYGRCQILFAYLDYLQQQAEDAFQLHQEGCLVLPVASEAALVGFDTEARLAIFNASTFDCEICLEPKKGISCYQLHKCGHVFCRQCLQDCFNNAITEGTVSSVKCLSPDCGKSDSSPVAKRKRKADRTLHPRELLAMGIEESMVRRYVEMKRKKKIESDRTTVYCPRTWCQAPARSGKYPAIPADLTDYVATDSPSEGESDDDTQETDPSNPSERPSGRNIPPTERLAVCEKCQLAFCKVCYMGWHGEFARCYPRDPAELSAEEQASYDYIRLHTSACPHCNSPTQKTFGCNHMQCVTCNSHYCYLCTAWLDPQNPYQHFNKPGTGCYQRLWELEEGDEGQAPGDGQGFAGARRWEQLAIEVAREENAREAAEAARAAPGNQRNRARQDDDRELQEIQRFLELARLDEEEDWDSDGLGDDDDRFVIH